MERKEKEEWINRLLVYMNDEIERKGCRLKQMRFDFDKDQEDLLNFSKKNPINISDFFEVLNICKSRGYIEKITMGGSNYNYLYLSETGQGRAISFMNQDKTQAETAGHLSVGTINVNAPTQIGNHNVQNIENFFIKIVERIDKSDASENEKKEIKGKLRAFLEHPVTNTVLGVAFDTLIRRIQ